VVLLAVFLVFVVSFIPRLNNKLSAVMTNGGKTSGDWKQYALSTAVEGGYQFDIRDDVSLTPYARLAFVQMTSESVKLSNGMKGGIDKPRSVTGEVGAKLAGKFSAGSTEFKPYLSAAVVQELADSNEVTINGRNRFDNNVKETSGKYGLGAVDLVTFVVDHDDAIAVAIQRNTQIGFFRQHASL
jgi:outer membrane autotransporter protein